VKKGASQLRQLVTKADRLGAVLSAINSAPPYCSKPLMFFVLKTSRFPSLHKVPCSGLFLFKKNGSTASTLHILSLFSGQRHGGCGGVLQKFLLLEP
jgi:hypothetical protein